MRLPETYLIETYLTEAINGLSLLKILTLNNKITEQDPRYKYLKSLHNWVFKNSDPLILQKYGKELGNLKNFGLSDERILSQADLHNGYPNLGNLLSRLDTLMKTKGQDDETIPLNGY